MKQKKFIVFIAVIMVLVLTVSIFAACNKKRNNDYNGYSYRMGPSKLPTTWNLHTYTSNESTYVLDYSSDSLYTFDYKDDNHDAYAIVPSMAADFPTDITAQVVAQEGKADLWNLYEEGYVATLNPDGAYIVEPDSLDENGTGVVGDDDYDDYSADYDDYIAAGNVVRVDLERVLASEDRVYSIPLKHNLKFDNGDPITANTFVESLKLLLAPDASNYRADNVYKGDLVIANAENYFKAGKITLEDVTDGTGDGGAIKLESSENWNRSTVGYGGISEDLRSKLFFDTEKHSWMGAQSADWYDGDVDEAYAYIAAAKGVKYIANDNAKNAKNRAMFKAAFASMNGKSIADILELEDFTYDYVDDKGTEDEADDEEATVTIPYADLLEIAVELPDYLFGGYYPNIEFSLFAYEYTWPTLNFSDVGFYAADDYTLVIVLKKAMDDNFYLRYGLCTSFFLVHPELYKQCEKRENGVYSNTYGTSVGTYIGYGPYKLTNYVADSTIILERNTLWHGFDPQDASYKEGTYQTDRVVFKMVTEDSTRLEMFLKGELDSYGLQEQDMKDYLHSKYTVFTDSESTWYLAMNPDFDNLHALEQEATPVTEGNEVNKTIISIQEFRQALSYSLDREQFNLELSPTSGVAKALLSSMIVADPESGRTYRSLDQAKDAILSFWGLSDKWGDGKTYKDRDDAIDHITGYDPEGAKDLFRTAYNTAVSEGYLSAAAVASGNWEVQIIVGRPSAGNFYQKGFDFLKKNWEKAVEGTPFEGHLQFIFSEILASFGKSLRTGKVDLLFGVGYGGSMFNPYSMMDCFTGYQDGGDTLMYDPFTDKKKINLDITYDFGDGVKTYRASLYAWVSEALQGEKITIKEVDANGNTIPDATLTISAGSSDDPNRRIAILAACEEAIMNLSNVFPLMTDASASLHCMRINYMTDEYVVGMGFGGIQYYTYTMTDAEFLAFARKQGGTLNYKG